MWHGTFYIMKANELLKLITVAFSMETLQLNCVLSWTLLEFHHVRNFTAGFKDERFTDSRKVYEAITRNLLCKRI